ncbi:MAG: hypothetical protein ACJAXB_002744 [Candidatus Endobugula sp.]|jgi:hypothetical protein
MLLLSEKSLLLLMDRKKTANSYILMAERNHLTPTSLESGDRARMKILRINPNRELPINVIEAA